MRECASEFNRGVRGDLIEDVTSKQGLKRSGVGLPEEGAGEAGRSTSLPSPESVASLPVCPQSPLCNNFSNFNYL